MATGSDLPERVEPPCWRVSRPKDFCEFLRHLPSLVPPNSVLRLQSGESRDIEAYFLERPAIYENEIDQGWFKLRPKIFYMPMTDANLQGLADLAEKHAEPEVGNELSVYWNDQILLSWHDLPDDPFYVSYDIDKAALKHFREALQCEYVVAEEPSRQA